MKHVLKAPANQNPKKIFVKNLLFLKMHRYKKITACWDFLTLI